MNILTVSGTGISLLLQRSIKNANSGMLKSLQRLSTGQKINSASDNASALSIATTLTSQITGLTQAKKNTNQGIDITSLANSSLQNIQNSLLKMRNLALKASSDIYSEQEREAMQNEANSLVDEVYTIKNTTNYNGIKIFDTSSYANTSSGSSTSTSASVSPELASSSPAPVLMTSSAPTDSSSEEETNEELSASTSEEELLISTPMSVSSAPMLTGTSSSRTSFTYKGNTYNTTTTTLSGTSLDIDKFTIDSTDYYIIDTMEQLQAINTSSTTLGYNYVLGADIDMQEGKSSTITDALDADKTGYTSSQLSSLASTLSSSGANTWTAIGNSTNKFTGYFDGNGYEIEHLFINSTSDYQGLFGDTTLAYIENVTLTNSFVYSTGDNIGGIIGCSDNDTTDTYSRSASTISCSKVTNSAICGGDYVGSIAGKSITCSMSGYNPFTIMESYSTDTIVQGNDRIGGIIGYSDSIETWLTSCYVNNNTVSGTNCVAGLTGCSDVSFNGCYVTNSEITGTSYVDTVSIDDGSITGAVCDVSTTVNGTQGTAGSGICYADSWFATSTALSTLGISYELKTGATRPTLIDNPEESTTPARTFTYKGNTYNTTTTTLSGTSLDIDKFTIDSTDYYIIDTMEQLQAINTSSTTLGYNYVLGADIDMQSGKSSTITDALDADKTGYSASDLTTLKNNLVSASANTWTAIGSNSNAFTGYFDGNGYEIEHMFINSTSSCQGLFGRLDSGANVENVEINNSFVYSTTFNVGIIAGFTSSGSTISSSNVQNSALSSSSGTSGGIVGNNYGTIQNSYSKDCIIYASTGGAAGIAGNNYGTIQNTYTNNNTINGGEDRACGIEAGYGSSSGIITNSYVTNGTITGGSNSQVVTYVTSTTNSYFDETTTVNGVTYTSGTTSNGATCETASWFASSAAVTALGSAYTLQTNAARPTLVDNVETDVESTQRTFTYRGTTYNTTTTTLSGTSLDIDKFTIDSTDYYIIDTMEQLQAINTSSTTLGYNYVLGADIDMQEGNANYTDITAALDADKTGYNASDLITLKNNLVSASANTWTAIGNSTNAFTGYFDGNGHEIEHMFINSTLNNQGLFGYLGTYANVENVDINNSFIYTTGNHVGGITGSINSGTGTISDSHVDNSAIYGYTNLGSISGTNYGTITTSYSKNSIIYATSSNSALVGGITGSNRGTISNTYTNNNTVSSNGSYVSGIASSTMNGTVQNSYVTNGTITGASGYTYAVSQFTSTNSYFDEATTVNGSTSTSGTTSNGATCETASWFASSAAATALGAEYSLQTDAARPTLVDNVETDVEHYTPTRTFTYRGTTYNATTTTLSGTSLDIDKFTIDSTDYYIIDTMEQLQAINTSSTTLGYNYVLGADIDMQSGKSSTITDALDADKTNYSKSQLQSLASTLSSASANTWTSIGNSTNAFTGYFDGNGYEIEHMFVNSTSTNQGLFGYASGATIENIAVANSFVYSTSTNVGTIAGNLASGSTISCSDVTNSAVYAKQYAGGIAGINYGTIETSYSKDSIIYATNTNQSYAGGIAGGNGSGTIQNTYTNNNTVTGAGKHVGGITGDGSTTNSYVTNGRITGSSSTNTYAVSRGTSTNSYFDEATTINGTSKTSGTTSKGATCKTSDWFASSAATTALGAAYTLQTRATRPTLVDNVETDVERAFVYRNVAYTITNTTLSGTSLSIDKFTKDGADYYIIDTMEQLQAINTSSTTLGYNYVLGADIDMQSGKSSTITDALDADKTEYSASELTNLQSTLVSNGANTWTSIGNQTNKFTGYFDGNGYEIEHMFVNSTSDYQGLFGFTHNATIENVQIDNSFVYSTGDNVGTVVGFNYGSALTNCAVSNSAVDGYDIVGGIAGTVVTTGSSITDSDITNSVVYGHSAIGGIAGYNATNGTIQTSYSKNSNITAYASDNSEVGGIAGDNDGTIQDIYTNNNTITGISYVGGIVGSGSVTNSYVTNGTITGNSNVYAVSQGTSTNSYFDEATTVNGSTSTSGTTSSGATCKSATWFASSYSVTALGSAFELQTDAARPTLVDNVETDVEPYTPTTRTFNYRGTDYTATQTQLTGTSLDIYTFEKDGADYYIIDTMEQLQAINTSSTTLGYNYVLGADIDMQSDKSSTITDALDADKTGYSASDLTNLKSTLVSNGANEWTAIGTFTGYFDGNGYEIEHMFVNSTSHRQGLFSSTSGATIENVSINNSFVYSTSEEVGGIVGDSHSSTISSSKVTNTAIYGNQKAGSIAGIIDEYATGTIVESTIETSYSKNSIICTTHTYYGYAGGIVGYVSDGTIRNTYTNNNTVTAIGQGVGGITGNGTSGTTQNSYVTNGRITGGSFTTAVSGGSTSTNSYFDEATTVNGVSSTSGTTSNGATCESATWFASSSSVTALGSAFELQTDAARPTLVDNVETDVEPYTPTTKTFNYRGRDYTATLTQLTGTSLDIYTFEKNGADYYIIDTMEQLQAINTSSTTLGYNYVLGADIDMQSGKSSTITDALDADKTGYSASDLTNLQSTLVSNGANTWTAIGNSTNKFTGYFDGNGYEIEHMFVNSSSTNQGLFGYIDGGELENITINNSFIYSTSTNVGGIVGGVVSGTISASDVTNSAVYGNNCVGGIAGYHRGIIETSYSKDSIIYATNTSNDFAGGIAGDNTLGTIQNTYTNNNTVTGAGKYVGGITGTGSGGTNSYVTNGTITGESGYTYAVSSSSTNSYFDEATTVNGVSSTSGTTSGGATCESASWFASSSSVAALGSAYTLQTNAARPTLVDNAETDVEPYTPTTRTFNYRGTDYTATQTQLTGTSLDIYKFEKDGSDYYIIDTMEQLQAINTSNTTLGYNYVLGADIDMQSGKSSTITDALDADKTGYSASDLTNLQSTLVSNGANTWTAIGNSTNKFTGYFDGNGYEIEHMFVNSTSNNQGLFGYIDGGELENITVNNSYVYSTGNNIGIIAGKINNSDISQSDVENSAVYGNSYTGSIAGYINGTSSVETSYSTDSNIYASNEFSGGLAGYLNGSGATIINSYTNNNTVNSNGNSTGIAYKASGNIQNTYVTNGNITGTNAYAISNGTLNNSYFNESTILNGVSSVAGSGGCMDDRWFATATAVTSLGSAYELKLNATRPTLIDNPEQSVEPIPTRTVTYKGHQYQASTDIIGSTIFDKIKVDGEDYYLIDELSQLEAINTEKASGSLDKNYILMTDIDMQENNVNHDSIQALLSADKKDYTDTQLANLESSLNSLGADKWSAIGDTTQNYTGTFDGNGHKIVNMVVNTAYDNQGLFGVTKGAKIDNLGVENSFINGEDNTGSIIGLSNGDTIVNNSYSFNNAIVGDNNVGGLVGGESNSGEITISNSYASLNKIKAEGNNAAGLIGNFSQSSNSTIESSYSYKNNIKATSSVAGLVANSTGGGNISRSYVFKNVLDENSPSSNSGYLVSQNSSVSLSYCYYDENTCLNGEYPELGESCKSSYWFGTTNAVIALGGAFELKGKADHITLKNNSERITEERVDPAPTETGGIKIQVGANSGESNINTLNTGFSIEGFTVDLSSAESASNSVDQIDAMMKIVSEKMSEITIQQTILESEINHQDLLIENYTSARSSIMDTDVASELTNYTTKKILTDFNGSLLAQVTKIEQDMVLSLINGLTVEEDNNFILKYASKKTDSVLNNNNKNQNKYQNVLNSKNNNSIGYNISA